MGNEHLIQISVDAIASRKLITSSPYKGLRYFELQDKDLFFGRDQFIEETLVKSLERTDFLLLVGASGSGKSSVVRAGLIPSLQKMWGNKFVSFVFKPGSDPLHSFVSLLRQVYSQKDEENRPDADANTLSQAVKTLKSPNDFWLIVIDQFEELFTISKDDQRDRFIDSLVQLIQAAIPSVKVVATMRADFLDRLSPYPKLVKLSDRPFITKMREDELRLAIEQPAAHNGVVFETGLVEEIIKAVQGQAGYLSQLQYTLDQLWESEVRDGGIQDRTLNIQSYRWLGGVSGALQKRVSQFYEGLTEPEKLAAQRIFLKLAELNGDVLPGQDKFVRRRASRSEFTGQTEQRMLVRLINAGVLVINWTESKGAEVEISQSSLLNSWGRLKDWLENSREDYHKENYLISQSFSNDLAKGPDLLDVKDEINALAEVLVMRDLQPPLAVGIFGSWGSGKSYAMHLMQEKINDLRGRKLSPEKAWGDEKKRDLYVGHIYQIRFDAWTYAKADLWSSLMQTIFYEFNRQLTLEKQIAEALVKAEKIPRSKVPKPKSKAFWQVLKLRSSPKDFTGQASLDPPLPDNKTLLQQKQLEGGKFWHVLNEMSESDRTLILQSELSDETLKGLKESKSQKELTDYLWEKIGDLRQTEKQELEDRTQDLKKEKQNLRLLILMRAPAYLLRKNWLLLITFIIGVIVVSYPLLPEKIKDNIPKTFHDFLASNPFQRTLIGGISAFLTGKSLWDKTREEQEKVLTAWKIGQETVQEQVKSVRDLSTAMYEDLLKSDSKIQKKVEDIQYLESQIGLKEQQLGLSSTFPSLNAFINDRLLTDSYSKQLGALQQVQRDLADLTTHFTFPSQGNVAQTEFKDKLEKLRQVFPRGPARIVLYIDDLDRCPPEQVVRVLEAVQLLLKTPLFIVVLALDDRYIARALEKVYEDVLKRGGKPSGIDYLEKIIQIPYRVRPIPQAAIGKYLKAHMDIQEIDNGDIDIEKNNEPDKQYNPNFTEKDLNHTSAALNIESLMASTSKLDGEEPDELVDPSASSEQVLVQENKTQSLKSKVEDLPIRVAKFTKNEFDILQTCCQQIELSPRTTKRLINIYKILKVIWFRSRSFESSENENNIRQITIAFLALSGRYPHLMRRIFSRLELHFEESLDLNHNLIDIFFKAQVGNHNTYLEQERNKFQNDVKNLIPDIPLKELNLEDFRLILSFCFVGDIGYDPDDFILNN